MACKTYFINKFKFNKHATFQHVSKAMQQKKVTTSGNFTNLKYMISQREIIYFINW